MFKTVITLVRGRASAAAEDLADRNALLILDQQMRDSQTALTRAQRALALAIAENAAETRHAAVVKERVDALEGRARAALASGREDLAVEAAAAIADLEHELDALERAQAAFRGEIAQLRRLAGEAQRRMAGLHHGRRVARVAEAVREARRDRAESAGTPDCTLAEAEATLARLRERQTLAMEAADAMDGMQPDSPDIETRLAEAGCGPALRPTAASVLARLKIHA